MHAKNKFCNNKNDDFILSINHNKFSMDFLLITYIDFAEIFMKCVKVYQYIFQIDMNYLNTLLIPVDLIITKKCK